MSQTAEQTMKAEQTVQVPARSESRRFWKMIFSMLKIGVIGFGGGSALIPVIEEEVVQEQKIISKKDYDEDVIAACVTPGALPVEIAAGSGLTTFGLKGMLLAAAAMAAPGALLTVLLLTVFSGSSVKSLNFVRYLSVGLGAFICSLLISYAAKTQKTSTLEGKKTGRVSLLIMISVFLLTFGKNLFAILGINGNPAFSLSTVEVLGLAFFGIFYTGCRFTKLKSTVCIITAVLYLVFTGRTGAAVPGMLRIALYLFMVLLSVKGIAESIQNDRKHSHIDARAAISWKTPLQQTGAWLILLALSSIPALLYIKGSFLLLGKGMLSSLISFGGGDAYLSVADGMFVGHGMVSAHDFYGTLVPAANVLPGSILCKILTGIGYFTGLDVSGSAAGGWLTALACLGVSVSASGLVFCWIRWLLSEFEEVTVFREISRWIRPIISGLLLNVTLTMVRTNIDTGAALGNSAAATVIITAVLTAANLFLMNRKHAGNGILIAASALTGALLLTV
ncbi:MAG: chromate transporter [Eubacterium sp.]